MKNITIGNIPAIVWGKNSDKAYLFVHGKMSSKEAAETFAKIADERGIQTVSFDLPGHGERARENERCDIWNGKRDLELVGEYVFANWKEVSLFACSLGAYFSLQTYPARRMKKCLFQSPVLDMEYLIGRMMAWFDVTEERLAREKEIETPVDVMTWAYYQYVKSHPTREWESPTSILFAGKDQMQSLAVVKGFADRFHCALTVAENSEHPFMGEGDDRIVEQWLRENI